MGGVCAMKKFDWKNFEYYFVLSLTVIMNLALVGLIIYMFMESSSTRLFATFIVGAVVISGTIAYSLVKHNEKS